MRICRALTVRVSGHVDSFLYKAQYGFSRIDSPRSVDFRAIDQGRLLPL